MGCLIAYQFMVLEFSGSKPGQSKFLTLFRGRTRNIYIGMWCNVRKGVYSYIKLNTILIPLVVNTKKYHVLAPMGRFQLKVKLIPLVVFREFTVMKICLYLVVNVVRSFRLDASLRVKLLKCEIYVDVQNEMEINISIKGKYELDERLVWIQSRYIEAARPI